MSKKTNTESAGSAENTENTEMYELIKDIVSSAVKGRQEESVAIGMLYDLYTYRIKSFQKNRLDLMNWAKSQLKEECNDKLAKTMTPYRSDKIIFLRNVLNWIEDN